MEAFALELQVKQSHHLFLGTMFENKALGYMIFITLETERGIIFYFSWTLSLPAFPLRLKPPKWHTLSLKPYTLL